MIDLTTEEEEIVAAALTMRQNHIETGNVLVSAKDMRHRDIRLQPLSMDQMKLIIKIEEIRAKIWH